MTEPVRLSRADVLTFGQAAAELGFKTPKVLRQAARDGRLRVQRYGKGPKSDRILRADLEAFKHASPCPSIAVTMERTWSPFGSTASSIASLIGAGRGKTRASTKQRFSGKSPTLRVVGSRND